MSNTTHLVKCNIYKTEAIITTIMAQIHIKVVN